MSQYGSPTVHHSILTCNRNLSQLVSRLVSLMIDQLAPVLVERLRVKDLSYLITQGSQIVFNKYYNSNYINFEKYNYNNK